MYSGVRYSILMPYYDRASQLRKTLLSLRNLYWDRWLEWEVVLVEDYKNLMNSKLHKQFIRIIVNEFADIGIKIIHEEEHKPNPSTKYNRAAAIANGSLLVLTSPECYHETEILFDNRVERYNEYTVCACKAVNKNGEFVKWYQHSKHTPKKYHFCSIISKVHFMSFGGFDEDFSDGYCFDDNAFLARVMEYGLRVKQRDDLIAVHQWHKKERPNNYDVLWKRNKKLYEEEYTC